MRSWLFVPADSARKLEKAASAGADVLILDLEDSVATDHKPLAREMVASYLTARDRNGPAVHVRINPFGPYGDAMAREDLHAVIKARPDGIMAPKTADGAEVTALCSAISVHEAEAGLPDGAIRLSAIATEVPGSLLAMGTYRKASHRLRTLTWGAEDLATALGAETNAHPDGSLTDPYRLARSLCLYAAADAGCEPMDTVYTDLSNTDGLKAVCEAARRDGFTGKMAIHPAQVPIINDAFTPDLDAIDRARAVVAAFAAAPDAGVVQLEGRMLDRPHLAQAERLLKRAARYTAT